MLELEFVTFTIGDDPQVYKLCYDFNELADAETLTGLNLNAAFIGGTVNANQFRGMLYAFLKTSHAVTLKEAGSLMATLEGRKKCLDAVGAILGGHAAEEIEETPAQ